MEQSKDVRKELPNFIKLNIDKVIEIANLNTYSYVSYQDEIVQEN
jgi:hypothetical protein